MNISFPSTKLQEKDTSAINRIIDNIKSHARYAELPNDALDALLTLYCTLNRIYPANKKKLTGDEVLEWMDQYDDFGLLLFEATDELSDEKLPPLAAKHIASIMELLDPNFVEACYKYARKYKYIDKNNIENIPDNHIEGAGQQIDFPELCKMLFLDTNLNGEDKLVPKLYRDTMKNLEHIYFDEPVEVFPEFAENLNEDDSTEDDMRDETPSIESPKQDTEADEVEVQEEPAEIPDQSEPSEDTSTTSVENKINQQAILACVNSLLQHSWTLVDEANSAIATIEYQYKEANKENLLKILQEYVDNSLIQIGMLSKVSELIDTKTSDLMADGIEKAEDIIQ